MRRAGGFAYLWTLMVVAMIGLGLAVAADMYSVSVRRDKEKELIFAGRQIREAIGRYYESAPGAAKQYPPSLDHLLKDPRTPGVRRHLRRIYSDPVTGEAEWGLVIVAGRVVGVHSLSQDKPIKVANFEPAEAAFAGKEKYSEWVFTYPPGLIVSKQAEDAVKVVTGSVSPEGSVR